MLSVFGSLLETPKNFPIVSGGGDKITQALNALPREVTEIDFSNKGFTGKIPPLIGEFKNLERLDLSGNDLCYISEELKHLPLKTLIITGNQSLVMTLEDWLGEISGLKLIALDLKLVWLPKGMHASQVECLDKEDLEWNEEEGCQTQLPLPDSPRPAGSPSHKRKREISTATKPPKRQR